MRTQKFYLTFANVLYEFYIVSQSMKNYQIRVKHTENVVEWKRSTKYGLLSIEAQSSTSED